MVRSRVKPFMSHDSKDTSEKVHSSKNSMSKLSEPYFTIFIELIWRFIGFTTFHSKKFLCLSLSERKKKASNIHNCPSSAINFSSRLEKRHHSRFSLNFQFLWQKRFFISLLSAIPPTPEGKQRSNFSSAFYLFLHQCTRQLVDEILWLNIREKR